MVGKRGKKQNTGRPEHRKKQRRDESQTKRNNYTGLPGVPEASSNKKKPRENNPKKKVKTPEPEKKATRSQREKRRYLVSFPSHNLKNRYLGNKRGMVSGKKKKKGEGGGPMKKNGHPIESWPTRAPKGNIGRWKRPWKRKRKSPGDWPKRTGRTRRHLKAKPGFSQKGVWQNQKHRAAENRKGLGEPPLTSTAKRCKGKGKQKNEINNPGSRSLNTISGFQTGEKDT